MREVQIPLLAVLLIGGCAAKGTLGRSARGPLRGHGPTGDVPVPAAPAGGDRALRERVRASASACCSPPGASGRVGPAVAVRAATALLFCTAAAALHELRARRPDAGCGCFGELSRTPVSWRAITRAALLAWPRSSSIGVPPLRMPARSTGLARCWRSPVAELAAARRAVTGDRPDHGPAGHAEPCELREVPVDRTLTRSARQRVMAALPAAPVTTTPTDVWREGCWRFVVFPGSAGQPPRSRWSSPSTWPAATPRSARACSTSTRPPATLPRPATAL